MPAVRELTTQPEKISTCTDPLGHTGQLDGRRDEMHSSNDRRTTTKAKTSFTSAATYWQSTLAHTAHDACILRRVYRPRAYTHPDVATMPSLHVRRR